MTQKKKKNFKNLHKKTFIIHCIELVTFKSIYLLQTTSFFLKFLSKRGSFWKQRSTRSKFVYRLRFAVVVFATNCKHRIVRCEFSVTDDGAGASARTVSRQRPICISFFHWPNCLAINYCTHSSRFRVPKRQQRQTYEKIGIKHKIASIPRSGTNEMKNGVCRKFIQ